MVMEAFRAEREGRWSELDTLVKQAGRSPRRLRPDAVRRLGTLYRAVIADLALARRRFPTQPETQRLEALARTARSSVYRYERRSSGPLTFITTTYWRRVRERPWFLVVSLGAMFVPWVLAGLWAVRDPGAAAGLAPAGFRSVVERSSADFGLSAEEKVATASEIFTHNIWVSILVFVLGLAAAVGACVLLAYQGVALGATFGLTIQAGNGSVLWEFVIPHGILELSCIAVAGVAGMRLGWAVVAPGHLTRGDALRVEARPAAEIVVGTAMCLVVAGIVEGTVSTSGVGVPLGLVIGIGLGVLFWGAVLVRGRAVPASAPVAGATPQKHEPPRVL